MQRISRLIISIALITAGSVSPAWDSLKEAAASAPGTILPEILATVGSGKITREDLRSRIGARLDEGEVRYLRVRSRMITTAIDEMVRERLLAEEARKQKTTPDELITARAMKEAAPSASQLGEWYQKNQRRFGGRSLNEVRPQALAAMFQERRAQIAKQLGDSLAAVENVTVSFRPYAVAFDNSGAASLGSSKAPVTIVEFSDFQCPFCATFAPNLKRIKEQFGDKVQVVYRHYPLSKVHPLALEAAQSSVCANEQGKFWEYHDLLFANQQRLSSENLRETARTLKLDMDKFDECAGSDRVTAQVNKDIEEGRRAGVTATPSLFVNGNQLPGGAVKYELLTSAVEQELARPRQAR